MNDPYDQHMARWIGERRQDDYLLARQRNREKIIHCLEQRYTVKIENYGHHINAYTSPGGEKPAFTITMDAAEEMSVDQLTKWIKTKP